MKIFSINFVTLLLLSAAQNQDQTQDQEKVPVQIEEETEIEFPVYIDLAKGERQHLVATGVREKFWIDVYGFGIYVDQVSAAKVMRTAFEKAAKLEDEDEQIAVIDNALLDPAFNKSMRWVMARDVEGEDIAEAFDDSLGPEINSLYKDEKDEKLLKKSLESMAQLREWFEKTNLLEDDELMFIWKGNTLDSVVNGKSLGVVDDFGVCFAMFRLFLNEDDPIDDDAYEAAILKLRVMAFPQTTAKEE